MEQLSRIRCRTFPSLHNIFLCPFPTKSKFINLRYRLDHNPTQAIPDLISV